MEALELTEIKETVKSAGISGIGDIYGAIIRFFTNIVITRFLGPEFYGIFVLGGTVVNVGQLVIVGGLQRGVLRFVSLYRGREKSDKVSETIISGTFMVSVIGTFVAILLYFLAKPIAVGIFHNPDLVIVIQILVISLPFGGIAAIWLSAIQGFKEIGRLVLIGILSSLIHLGFIGIAFLLGWRLLGLLVASVLASVMTCVLVLFFLKKSVGFWEKAKLLWFNWELVSFSLPLFFVNFLSFFMRRTDTLMLGYFKTGSEVGIYSVAYRISSLILLPLGAFRPIFVPMISEFFGRNEIQKIEDLFKMTTKWSFSLCIPIFLIITLFAPHILSIFGPHFVVGAYAAMVLGAAQLINCSSGPTQGVIIMSGHPHISLINSLILVCCNIVLNYLLIPRYGFMGAAMASGASIVAVNMIRIIEVYSLLKFHPYSTRFVKPLFAGIVSFLVTLAIKKFLRETSVNIVILEMLWCISLYIAVLYFLRLDKEDRFILSLIIRRFKSLVSPKDTKERVFSEKH